LESASITQQIATFCVRLERYIRPLIFPLFSFLRCILLHPPQNSEISYNASPESRLVENGTGKAAVASIPIPRLRDDYILVKTIAVALNPTDWQTLDETPKPGTTYSLLGCDAAGIVVEVGKNVTKKFKKGDRIAGVAHGGEFILNYSS
jgi:NADPH-dependent curcumin reductase CurA